MRTVLLSLMLFLLSSSIRADDRTDALNARAERAYANSEWASAEALYILVSEHEPEKAASYARTMIAENMRGDTAAVTATFERAMQAGVPLDSVLSCLRSDAFALGDATVYESTLLNAAAALPWMRRAIDVKLLEYYAFRRDPRAMIDYADRILSGIPDYPPVLLLLGKAYAMEGRYEDAAQTWQRALDADPDNFDILLELGNYYAATEPERALPYLRKACDIRSTPYLRNLVERLSSRL